MLKKTQIGQFYVKGTRFPWNISLGARNKFGDSDSAPAAPWIPVRGMVRGVREFGETTSSRAGRKGEAREAHSRGESQLGASEGESSRNLTQSWGSFVC